MAFIYCPPNEMDVVSSWGGVDLLLCHVGESPDECARLGWQASGVRAVFLPVCASQVCVCVMPLNDALFSCPPVRAEPRWGRGRRTHPHTDTQKVLLLLYS